MTISELRERLQSLERDGAGGYSVYVRKSNVEPLSDAELTCIDGKFDEDIVTGQVVLILS